jgi:hypothetical protein
MALIEQSFAAMIYLSIQSITNYCDTIKNDRCNTFLNLSKGIDLYLLIIIKSSCSPIMMNISNCTLISFTAFILCN